MRKKLIGFLLFGLLVFLAGCSPSQLQSQIKITRFDPILNPPRITSFINPDIKETFISYEGESVRINTSLFATQSIMILPITIFNDTDTDILPSEYSISLHDGKDLKTIKMLDRDDLAAARAKMEGRSSGGGNIETRAINLVVDSVNSITTTNTDKRLVMKGMDIALNDYFSFRPIYSGQKRFGILCFLADFRLEYPVALKVKTRDEVIFLKFMPAKDKTQE